MVALLLAACLSGGQALHAMTPAEVDRYLSELQARAPEFEARLADVAARAVGTPYHGGPLGEGPTGTHDKDPLIDLSRVDCVTFVEQCIALAASKSYDEAVERLQKIRYRDGRIDFEARNHFMETDWFPNNPFCRDATADLGVPTATVIRTISRREFFKKVEAPELGQDTPDREVSLVYVPSSRVAEAESRLPSPALVCFIGNVDWLFATHCGLYVRDDAGQGHLYHASTTDKRVVKVSLPEYVGSQERFLGFTAYRIGDPRPPARR
jgi:hypothetical protein